MCKVITNGNPKCYWALPKGYCEQKHIVLENITSYVLPVILINIFVVHT